MPSPFRTLVLDGLFVEQPSGILVCQTDQNTQDVDMSLSPFVGEKVMLILSHASSDAATPGMGSCKWPEGHPCPIHALHPDRMLFCRLDGVLLRDPWRILDREDVEIPLPLAGLPHHYGRLMVVTVLDTTQMTPQNLASSAQGLLQQLRAGLEGMKK